MLTGSLLALDVGGTVHQIRWAIEPPLDWDDQGLHLDVLVRLLAGQAPDGLAGTARVLNRASPADRADYRDFVKCVLLLKMGKLAEARSLAEGSSST